MDDQVNNFLDRIENMAPPFVREVALSSKQDTMGKAALADAVDVIPIIGDVANMFRVRHGGGKPERVKSQATDLLAGSLPEPLGFILDALSPTNFMTFLKEAAPPGPPNGRY